jgi:hypothetical protein
LELLNISDDEDNDDSVLAFVFKYGLLERYTTKPWVESLSEFHWKVRTLRRVVEDVYNTTDARMSFLIMQGPLSGCAPAVTLAEKGYTPAWFVYSGYCACYLRIWLDLLEGKTIRRCGHKHCGKFFYVTKENKRYCSLVCQNRAKQLRHYYKHKKEA